MRLQQHDLTTGKNERNEIAAGLGCILLHGGEQADVVGIPHRLSVPSGERGLTADERVPDRAVEAIMGHVFLPAVKRCASVC